MHWVLSITLLIIAVFNINPTVALTLLSLYYVFNLLVHGAGLYNLKHNLNKHHTDVIYSVWPSAAYLVVLITCLFIGSNFVFWLAAVTFLCNTAGVVITFNRRK